MSLTDSPNRRALSRTTRVFVLSAFGAGIGAVSGALSTVLFNDGPLLRNVGLGVTSGVLVFLWRGAAEENGLQNNFLFPAIMGDTPPAVLGSSLNSSAFITGFNTVVANIVVPKLEQVFPHAPDDKNLGPMCKPFLQFG